MNKDELIKILQERSQESITQDFNPEDESSSEHLKQFKVRRKEDKKIFRLNFIILLLLCTLGYALYYHFTNEKAVDLTKYIEKSAVSFTDLSKEDKEKYLPKSQLQSFQAQLREHDKNYIAKLEKDIEGLVVDLNEAKKAKTVVLSKAKTKSKRYNAIGCYDEVAGTKTINKACKDKISRFLKKTKKNTIKFEIIAVLDTKDKAFINNKVDQINTNKTIKNNLKEFLTQGLARTRVLEAAWLVKNVLGEKVLITYVNYIAKTEDKRGITIRAYY